MQNIFKSKNESYIFRFYLVPLPLPPRKVLPISFYVCFINRKKAFSYNLIEQRPLKVSDKEALTHGISYSIAINYPFILLMFDVLTSFFPCFNVVSKSAICLLSVFVVIFKALVNDKIDFICNLR